MALLGIPTLVIINGKLYSAGFGTNDKISSTLHFKIHPSHTEHLPSIKLQITAFRPTRREENQSHAPEYEANLFFPKDGIINYRYAIPTQTTDIDHALRVPGNQDMMSLRYLNFVAKEIIVETGLGGVPCLRTEQMTTDLSRLFTTVKNVNKIPEAVLEISCLFPNANSATDSLIHSMENRIFASSCSPSTSTSAHSSPAKRVKNRPQHLTMDSLFSKFKHHHSGSESSSTLNTPLSSPLHITDGAKVSTFPNTDSTPQQKKFDQWLSKAKNGASNPSKDKSAPKPLSGNKDKEIRFNCTPIGHRKGAFEEPERVGKKKIELARNEEKEGVGGKVPAIEAGEKATDDKWFCHKCNSNGHPDWWCPEPRHY